MKLDTLVEIISAAHLSHYVDGPFKERGGIMFVAPPGSFKSAIVKTLDLYPNALVNSDLTIKQGANLREDIASNKLLSLGFPAYEKLYQRHSAVASNIEGFVLGLTGEGFTNTNWEPARMIQRSAQALVVGAMTPSFYVKHYEEWIESGFARRFIWSHYVLGDPMIVARAIKAWERIDLSNSQFSARLPVGRSIKYNVTPHEDDILFRILKFQPGHDIAYSLLKKILCALKWKFPSESPRPMQLVKDFGESLGKNGSILWVDEKAPEHSPTPNTKTKTPTVSKKSKSKVATV